MTAGVHVAAPLSRRQLWRCRGRVAVYAIISICSISSYLLARPSQRKEGSVGHHNAKPRYQRMKCLAGRGLHPLIIVVAFMTLLGENPALAGMRDDVMSRAASCANMSSDRQWLDCYYGAAQPMRAELGLPAAPESQTQMFNATTQIAHAPTQNLPAIDHLSAKLVSYTMDRNGIFTVTLSNNQVWQQLPGDTTLAHWSRSSRDFPYNIQISPGALGSFDLRVEGLPGSYKVRRIQ